MKRMMGAALLALCLCWGTAQAAELPEGSAKSAILMAPDGSVLYENNADEPLQPASVTKIMTMLLTLEAVDSGQASLEDMVTASANAASMGGTQIFLKEGEQLSLQDMLKSIAVASANDAAVAVAEHLAGSEEGFVQRMNERAAQLGCTGTTFVNPNGLDADGQKTQTTARDLALISKELIQHEAIFDYTTIWMDSIRDGQFELANTNKLLRKYDGLVGLKTGYTSEAGFCISAVAKRDDLMLIAVVLGEPDKESRNTDITNMLNYGFSNYAMAPVLEEGTALDAIPVTLGQQAYVGVRLEDDTPVLLKKEQAQQLTRSIELRPQLEAPVQAGDAVGEVVLKSGDTEVARRAVVAAQSVEKKGIPQLWLELAEYILMKSSPL